MGMKQSQIIFPWDIFKYDIIFFDQKILKYLNDFQNRNVWVLWLKWTETMKAKQNQTFFHVSYFIGPFHAHPKLTPTLLMPALIPPAPNFGLTLFRAVAFHHLETLENL